MMLTLYDVFIFLLHHLSFEITFTFCYKQIIALRIVSAYMYLSIIFFFFIDFAAWSAKLTNKYFARKKLQNVP